MCLSKKERALLDDDPEPSDPEIRTCPGRYMGKAPETAGLGILKLVQGESGYFALFILSFG